MIEIFMSNQDNAETQIFSISDFFTKHAINIV